MKTILFDLDGTLHGMDLDRFAKAYFTSLIADFARHGFSPDGAKIALDEAFHGMMANRGERTNEQLFIDCFTAHCGEEYRKRSEAIAAEYYATAFDSLAPLCTPFREARAILDRVHALGIPAVLATNPIFPRAATLRRIAWAGLVPEDFTLITTYEEFSHTKPNLDYYRTILARIGAAPEECMMVGNDAIEDMAAAELGMRVFLLTEDLLNRKGLDISVYPHGGFAELAAAIEDFATA